MNYLYYLGPVAGAIFGAVMTISFWQPEPKQVIVENVKVIEKPIVKYKTRKCRRKKPKMQLGYHWHNGVLYYGKNN